MHETSPEPQTLTQSIEDNATIQFNLGNLYREGKGVTQDYKKAVSCYMKAANQGHAAAQNDLGLMYKDGQGVAQDYKEAAKWFIEAANQGHATAQYNLLLFYRDGQEGIH